LCFCFKGFTQSPQRKGKGAKNTKGESLKLLISNEF
jgi:hypothetical protein